MTEYQWEIEPYQVTLHHGHWWWKTTETMIKWRVEVFDAHGYKAHTSWLDTKHEAEIWLDEWMRDEKERLDNERALKAESLKGTMNL